MRSVDKETQHNPWPHFLSASLNDLKKKGLYRQLRFMGSPVSTWTTIGDRSYLLFCSNDYLGLASDIRMRKVGAAAVQSWGTGSGASRLISGNLSLYRDLEKDIASFKRTERALVFSCGYSTNLGVISSLVGNDDLILSDALNHASIVDACRLSKAKTQVYPHGDFYCLENLLSKKKVTGKVLVVTDGIFSMDGDLAPLLELHKICKEYGAFLMVDDAHGTGVVGPRGGGSLDYFNIEEASIIQVGTFSKALGSLGGFVTGSTLLIDFILNHARSLIYSTGLPPSILAANREGLRIIQEEPFRRERLFDLTGYLRAGLERLGITSPAGPTPILPLVTGSANEAVSLSQYLLEEGIFVPAIRPPTVPEDKCRLRISLSALHTRTELDRLLLALEAYYKLGS